MGSDYIKKLRSIDKMHNRTNDQEMFIAKVQNCYTPVKRFVDKEIEKGVNMFDAIDNVLGSASIQRLCPDLNEEAVKRKVRNLLISYYINRDKPEQGDER